MKGRLLHQVSLADFTTWKVGGMAKTVFIPTDFEDLKEFLIQLPKEEPLMWLGQGSNVLVCDSGFKGTVILTKNLQTLQLMPKFLSSALIEEDLTTVSLVRVECGCLSPHFAHWMVQQGFGGIEFLAGIPGTIGGALVMNAGAHGSCTWEHVAVVEMIDRTGEVCLCYPHEFDIGYRQVQLKGALQEQRWFTAAYFIGEPGDELASKRKIQEILKRRRDTQPLTLPNAGSVFQNPKDDFAGRLIEVCGLKGFCVGDACVSEKHANFIVNQGRATATDIEQLIRLIQQKVDENFGVHLVTEIKIIG
ncbi:MAG: UDP-N-acetylmuramate dehydrogenase [Gammaproteobacteria bacterium]|nr:UDP-N-acetylmuramate dehydrogenase [Gammaproteobacteria bacterium]MBU2546138.1 UDP-N-acetylmuramate dehydrogenase [Gammaproteobacteria bacterium]